MLPVVARTHEIDELLAADTPVAIGVSGGKDSSAVVVATVEYLDHIGHAGPRILIHADLGVTEWKASLPMCELLADKFRMEFVVVKRPQGDMMERWEQRWHDNCERYRTLSCVKLILPWSTPEMRFCTSELKIDQICRYLKNRFQGKTIISVNGIRREESDNREKAPVSKAQPKLAGVKTRTTGFDWHPIIEWKLEEVLACLQRYELPLHEAYTVWGTTRVSCAFCIMSAFADLEAAARCPDNADLFRRMSALEIASTFAFQGGKWLSDVATHLLDEHVPRKLQLAKGAAKVRMEAEAWLPKHLLYTKGWPTCVPTSAEAVKLAYMRDRVGAIVHIPVDFTRPQQVLARYRELLAAKEAKLETK